VSNTAFSADHKT